MQKLSRFILKFCGWKTVLSIPEPPKSIICVAPHTSNWDFFVGKLAYWAMGRKASFLIKKSWFFFPMNLLFNAMGGVPIDRSKRGSMTQQMAEEFSKREHFHLAITPEGTRSLAPVWKMGFYYIALKANVPIQLAYLDFKKKEVGITRLFTPTGDEQADLATIQEFYKDKNAKFPHKFNLSQQ
jgi:1-acyl-sn-glycerol-3-phosphate acyltransferase